MRKIKNEVTLRKAADYAAKMTDWNEHTLSIDIPIVEFMTNQGMKTAEREWMSELHYKLLQVHYQHILDGSMTHANYEVRTKVYEEFKVWLRGNYGIKVADMF